MKPKVTAGKRRLWELLEPPRPGDRLGRAFDVALLALIFLNVLAVIVGTVPAVAQRFGGALDAFELVSVVVFSVEYLARLWVVTEDPRYAAPVEGRLRYALSPMALVDLLAIVPFYLPFAFVGADLRSMRALRLLRLFRLAKLGRYVVALRLLGEVLRTKRAELTVTLMLLLLLLVVASSLMYFAENGAQPDVFSSIPASMWWAVVTVTTVGYGDTYPITPWGQMIGAVVAVLGIGFFALPTAILGAAFVEGMALRRTLAAETAARRCPHCGGPLG